MQSQDRTRSTSTIHPSQSDEVLRTVTAQQDSGAPTWRTLTYADAVAHCPTHRVQHEEAEARYAEFLTENGASTQRRDRRQLGLRFSRRAQEVDA